jgi:hypothetical protein
MQVLKQLFAFYVFGNIHVAVAAYCLTKISFLQFDINHPSLANFVFFSTIVSYNLIRLFQIDKINSMMAIWIRANRRSLIVLNSVAFLGSLYGLLAFRVDEILVLLPLSLATIFYAFPFKIKTGGLRNIPGIKLFLIAITWTGLTLYLPLISAGVPISDEVYPVLVQRFLFVIAITIPFDIRDAQFDVPGLHTIPQLLGVNTSKIVAVLALFAVVVIDMRSDHQDSLFFWINLLIMVLSMVMVLFSGIKRQRFYTAFWIEALPIFWYLLLLVLVV